MTSSDSMIISLVPHIHKVMPYDPMDNSHIEVFKDYDSHSPFKNDQLTDTYKMHELENKELSEPE